MPYHREETMNWRSQTEKMNMFNGLFVLKNMLHNSHTLQFSGCLYKTC